MKKVWIWSGATMLLTFFLLNSCSWHKPDTKQEDKYIFAYKIIPGNGSGYGYEIYINNKLYIQQKIIPGLPGKKPFKTKEDAEKVARLVLKKLKKESLPPISIEELRELHVLPEDS